jgi:hypothetical protein
MLTTGQTKTNEEEKKKVIPIEKGKKLFKKIGMINFVKITNVQRISIATITWLIHRMEA